MAKQKPGTIGWIDLTVPNAESVSNFYQRVVGWEKESLSMGDYDDYCMIPQGGEANAGICHARGGNSDLPAQWLIYINVTDLDESVAAVKAEGGQIIVEPRDLAGGRFCVIRDPAGAVSALYQAPE